MSHKAVTFADPCEVRDVGVLARGGRCEAEEGRSGLVASDAVGDVEGHRSSWVMLEDGAGEVLSVCAEAGTQVSERMATGDVGEDGDAKRDQ